MYGQTNDKPTLKRLNRLLEDAVRNQFEGIGKPEQLRYVLVGCWCRRIDGEHRLVCLVDGDDVVVLQARFHYGN
jgi:toxin YoeB